MGRQRDLVVDHQPQGSLQALADRLADGLQHLDAGIPLAVRFDDRPRCVQRGGAVQHLLNGVAVLIQLLPISPILVGDLPLLVGHFLSLPKPPQLLVRIDVKPEL
jgi:hypothetical protein